MLNRKLDVRRDGPPCLHKNVVRSGDLRVAGLSEDAALSGATLATLEQNVSSVAPTLAPRVLHLPIVRPVKERQ